MRLHIVALAFALTAPAAAQTSPAPPPALPQYMVGIGPTWLRGAANPYNVDANFAVRVGQTRFYSYTTASTPIVAPAPGAPPVASTFTTGAAYVPAQSPGGSVSLVLIAQAGFSAAQVNSAIAPSFSGSIGVAFRLGKRPIYLMPFVKAANASASPTSGALGTAVLQPGVQILYGFGGSQ